MRKACLLSLACVLAASAVNAADQSVLPKLKYSGSRQQQLHAIPIPESGIPTVTAQPWARVSTEGIQLEGPAFDRDGNLLLVEVLGGRVFKIDARGNANVLVSPNSSGSAGIAIHKDGRIFVAGLGNYKDTGNLTIYRSDGSLSAELIGRSMGYMPDDLVFDSKGGLYFTDFRGGSTDPIGGVYYIPPNSSDIVPVVKHMGLPNGIALSPDGKTLWVTEFATGLLHRVDLANASTVEPFGSVVAYHFNAPSPDSMRADEDGNLYVAQYGQGRVLVLNRNGHPIGQILMPGRETGHFLRSTSMAFKPGTREIYFVANDGDEGQGAMVFRAEGFANGLNLYSHQ